MVLDGGVETILTGDAGASLTVRAPAGHADVQRRGAPATRVIADLQIQRPVSQE